MSILIFLIILSVLVIVHELGHFLSARYFGIRVDEFGLGYPPKAKKLFRWRGTDFTLNWLPFGGFVKIFGENPSEVSEEIPNPTSSPSLRGFPRSSDLGISSPDNFQHKNRGIQAAVLFAGVFFNFLFAWLLVSVGLATGLPAPSGLSLPIENPETVVTLVMPDSPADKAEIKTGDVIISIDGEKISSPEEVADYISRSLGPITLEVKRRDEITRREVLPEIGITEEGLAIGIAMETIGIVNLPWYSSIWEGAKLTWDLALATAKALGGFISQAFVGKADLTQVTGPVGIVGMVGDVSELGFNHLLTFTALISINLCLINLLPFPALDGGRLLFVGIESILRKPIPPRVFNALNTAGFALLIFLMILITIRDVRNIL